MPVLAYVLLIFALLLLIIGAMSLAGTWPGNRPPGLPLTIQTVQRLATLVTAKIDLSDRVFATVQGYAGGLVLAVDVRGSALIGADLDRAELRDVNREQRSGTLRLPPPRVISVAIDHASSTPVHSASSGLWAVCPPYEPLRSKLLADAFRQAQEKFSAVASQPRHLDAARRHAEQVLGDFADKQGWTLKVEWTDR
jgi:hypothetical protein